MGQDLLGIGVGRIVRSVVVGDVVAGDFANPSVATLWVCRVEQLHALCRRVDFHALIGRFVKEAVTASGEDES